jgi:hypothetical protein
LGLFRWLESKVFLGDVVKDYGVLDERRYGIGRMRTSVVLCRRKGKLRLVIRSTVITPLGGSVSYAVIYVTEPALTKLAEVLRDALAEVTKDQPHE